MEKNQAVRHRVTNAAGQTIKFYYQFDLYDYVLAITGQAVGSSAEAREALTGSGHTLIELDLTTATAPANDDQQLRTSLVGARVKLHRLQQDLRGQLGRISNELHAVERRLQSMDGKISQQVMEREPGRYVHP